MSTILVFGMTHNEHLVVFINVQNLVSIAAVILTVRKFEHFGWLVGVAHLA